MSQEQLTQPHSHKSTGSSPAYLALDSFLLDGRSRNLAPRTLEYYRQQLCWFVEFVGVDVGPRDLTATHIRSYLIHLQDRGWKATSQLAAARAIRAYCKFLVRDEWIASSPMDKVRMPSRIARSSRRTPRGKLPCCSSMPGRSATAP